MWSDTWAVRMRTTVRCLSNPVLSFLMFQFSICGNYSTYFDYLDLCFWCVKYICVRSYNKSDYVVALNLVFYSYSVVLLWLPLHSSEWKYIRLEIVYLAGCFWSILLLNIPVFRLREEDLVKGLQVLVPLEDKLLYLCQINPIQPPDM